MKLYIYTRNNVILENNNRKNTYITRYYSQGGIYILVTKLVDTNVLLDYPQILQEKGIMVHYSTIEELDELKTAPGERGYSARRAIRALESNAGNYELCTVEVLGKKVDDILVFIAENFKYGIITNDINLRVKCLAKGVPCSEYHIQGEDYTNSYKIEYSPTEQELAAFYEGKTQPEVKENQYLLIKDADSQMIDKYGKRNGELERLHYQTIESDYLGRSLYLSLLSCIREVKPKEFKDISDTEFQDIVLEQQTRMNESLKRITEYVLCQEKADIYSPKELNEYLLSSTSNPSIGIDFFVTDDETFQDELKKNLREECIYIRGRGQEETVYSVLYELKKIESERTVLIVKSLEAWERLRRKGITNAVLIPWFSCKELVAIPENTNIVVLGENDPSYPKSVINLRHRKTSTVQKTLIDAGMDSAAAYDLIKKTHGLYIPIKRSLLNGHRFEKAPWVESIRENISKTALLLGTWEENEGDKELISELSGTDYESFIDELRPYSEGEEPFVIIFKRYGKTICYLADPDYAWSVIKISPDETIWKKFEESFRHVMNADEELFSYSYDERINASLHNEKLYWSKRVRDGMLRTLLMQSYYVFDQKTMSRVNFIISELLKNIDNEKKWKYIAGFFKKLAEISPTVAMDRVEQEFKHSTGLFSLFEDQPENFLLEKLDYIDILWGIEQLLLIEEYAPRAFDLLLRIDNLDYEYRSNSVSDIIKRVLYPAIDFSAITVPEMKYSLAEKMFEVDRNAWDRLYDSLVFLNSSFFGDIVSPEYRMHNGIKGALLNDLYDLDRRYYSLLMEKADNDVKRWKKIIRYSSYVPPENRDETLRVLKTVLDQADDEKKEMIRDEIGLFISDQRYFCDSDKSLSEEEIKKYEQLYHSVTFEKPEYGFVYLFDRSINRKTLHPEPLHSNDHHKSANENHDLFDEEIRNHIRVFQKNRYDLNTLASLCAKKSEHSSLGDYIARYWQPHKFDLDTAISLLQNQNSGKMGVDYIHWFAPKDRSVIGGLIFDAEKYGFSKDAVMNLYLCDAIESEEEPLISKASEEEQKTFWNQHPYYFKHNFIWAINHCRKYGSFQDYMYILYFALEEGEIKEEDLPGYFDDFEDTIKRGSNGNPFPFTSLLEVLQKTCGDDEKKLKTVSEIERICSALLNGNQMKCTRILMQRDPESEIYMKLFKSYMFESAEERKAAENDLF